jgi:hypothetical protein
VGDISVPASIIGTALLGIAGFLIRENAKLREKAEQWESRWRDEVRRGARLALLKIEPHHGKSVSLPPPEWEENTQTRGTRTEIEQSELDRLLREFADSTPPKK